MLTEIEILRVAIEAGRNHKTVRSWARGEPVSQQSEAACEAAARRLGINLRRLSANP